MISAGVANFRIPDFQRSLLSWFDAHARDLPWRRTAEAYPIWVSEIMLQQTRVAAVLEHYARFLALFPSMVALALAQEEEVLAAWSGLGYYRRAKLLHKAAQFIVRERQGSLPRTSEQLRTLPGVGEYTAAAIASIAYGEPVAAVDGNVERVIGRLFLPSEAERPSRQWVRERATSLLARSRAGDFNQSMMELGATVCLPRKPLCLTCPVEKFCSTRGEHAAAPRKRMQRCEIAYAIVSRGKAVSTEVFLEQRAEEAVQMPGMWELPQIAFEEGDRAELTLRHSITVTNYYVRILKFSVRESHRRLPETVATRQWVRTSELGRLPLTGLARKALRRLGLMPAAQSAVRSGQALDFAPDDKSLMCR